LLDFSDMSNWSKFEIQKRWLQLSCIIKTKLNYILL
jgi:hypothetical protein